MDGRVCVLNWIGKIRRFFGKSLDVLMSDSGGLRCIRRTYHRGASEELENGIFERIKRAGTPVFMLKSVFGNEKRVSGKWCEMSVLKRREKR